MRKICLYLHVHQPLRLKNLSIFDISYGNPHTLSHYIDEKTNEKVFNKVAQKSYLPANTIFKRLLEKNEKFKINLSITGTLIEQAKKSNLNVLDSFAKLTKTGKAEILAETYYHTLASLYSQAEFKSQVKLHAKMIKKIFNQTPISFRNTELIYSDWIAQMVEDMGYKNIITEGHEKFLHWKSPNYLYTSNTKKGMNLLLKNYKLSDDIAWRFSNKGWGEYPLTAEKYLHWLDFTPGDTINLFMDFETLGEHQWADTGIFNFLESFVNLATKNGYEFINIKESGKKLKTVGHMTIDQVISWADEERDTSAWNENSMQKDTLEKIYSLEKSIKQKKNKSLLKLWRIMQTSDHFYYMCTKWFNDGDAHKYFSPYGTPHQAYCNFSNSLISLNQIVRR